ncbi:bifunctional diaminohydroxyphosphoribosylaminopyrimidine deaminase/5-amino-6-(5-phosphoribosylamino)uracil reductase RibD [Candidatus Micrarchaeota archaeon]|nr:bifunctional diaminohydroxyphosphoribosylaminopyrimidine deaminase/5-amino-6-(5-phosphoribosylamino)uracil reductase RibD [Candidatus Micrarchaeota archaeon]
MHTLMEMAFELARKSNPFPNPRVGAVIAKEGRVIGRGYHKKPGMPHAEIEAMQDAQRAGESLSGSTLYATLEPCSHTSKRTPPCAQEIISKGIKKVVFAMEDPNPLVGGAKLLREAGIEVEGPCAKEEGVALNREYLKNIMQKPLVAIKMAMSADGKTATRNGDSHWISGEESREYVHKLRSDFDAVVVGAGTIKADNPQLTSRIRGGKNPYRIIVDGSLGIPLDSKVLANTDGKTIIATTEKAPRGRMLELETRANCTVFCCGKESVDMQKLVSSLSAMGMKKILIEGGSELNASALEAGVVDKLYLFIAPKIIGGKDAKGVIGGAGISSMGEAIKLGNMKTRKMGEDLLLEFSVKKR